MKYYIYDNGLLINSIESSIEFIREYCSTNNYAYKEVTSTLPKTPTEKLQEENRLLKAQLKAQTERSDFIEDCIAEMAGVVYNTEETT